MAWVWLHLVVASAVWAGTGFAFGGMGWFTYFMAFLLVQAPNGPIFPVTYGAAWASFCSILYRRRNRGWHGFILAGTVPFGGAGLFELLLQSIGSDVQPSQWVFSPWGTLNLTAWVLLGLTGVYAWRVGRSWWALVLLYGLGWVVWVLVGYPQTTWGSFAEFPGVYVLTALLKVGSFLIFAIPLAYSGSNPANADQ